jgi:hypothetical protein
VLAQDVFARLSMIPLAEIVYRSGDIYKCFQEEKTALRWLLSR